MHVHWFFIDSTCAILFVLSRGQGYKYVVTPSSVAVVQTPNKLTLRTEAGSRDPVTLTIHPM